MFAGAAVSRSSLDKLSTEPPWGRGGPFISVEVGESKLFTDSRMAGNQAGDCPAPYSAFSNVTLAGAGVGGGLGLLIKAWGGQKSRLRLYLC